MTRSNLAALALTLAGTLFLTSCAATSHSSQRSSLGVARRYSDLAAVIDQPGPLEVETINSADWAVPRSGLIDLGDETARAQGLKDGDEPIQVFFHVIHHPTRGTFIIDTGIERALRDNPSHSAVSGLIRSVMHLEKLRVHVPLGDWLAAQREPLRGVFMTHLHLDHLTGMPDVPRGTPIYAGPGETGAKLVMNLFTRSTANKQLEGQAPVQEWPFIPDADGRFAGIVDVFGDGSLWAIWVPGHTPGSTAYLARTTHGPVLFTGDASHTAWGWTHDVGPGTFTADHAANLESLWRLKELVREHPEIDVRLGHQYLPSQANKVAALQATTLQEGR